MANTDTDTPEVDEEETPQDALPSDDLDNVSGGARLGDPDLMRGL